MSFWKFVMKGIRPSSAPLHRKALYFVAIGAPIAMAIVAGITVWTTKSNTPWVLLSAFLTVVVWYLLAYVLFGRKYSETSSKSTR